MTSKQSERIGWPTILGLSGVVCLMMVLAACMTATGTARFMAPMGHDIKVGYCVGITLELAKDMLPVAVLALWTRRARSGVGAWRRLALRCDLQLLGNARHGHNGNLVDRTDRQLEDGGADECENRSTATGSTSLASSSVIPTA